MAELLEELLARCRSGDRDAIDTLVRRFRSYAMNLALHMLHDHHAAEDAVQSAFLVVLQRLDDLRTPAAFPGWLRQIVRTQAHRIIRRRRDDAVDSVAAEVPAPDRRLENEELRGLLRRAVADLPPSAREAAELYYLSELDHYRVAEALDIPTGTVKRRLHDARRALRDGLARHARDADLPL